LIPQRGKQHEESKRDGKHGPSFADVIDGICRMAKAASYHAGAAPRAGKAGDGVPKNNLKSEQY
jgi:hypothetical protein